MTIFGVRLPSLRAPRHVAPQPAPPVALPDTRTFLVLAHWPDRKITYELGLKEALETARLSFASGATSVTVEPAWDFRAAS